MNDYPLSGLNALDTVDSRRFSTLFSVFQVTTCVVIVHIRWWRRLSIFSFFFFFWSTRKCIIKGFLYARDFPRKKAVSYLVVQLMTAHGSQWTLPPRNLKSQYSSLSWSGIVQFKWVDRENRLYCRSRSQSNRENRLYCTSSFAVFFSIFQIAWSRRHCTTVSFRVSAIVLKFVSFKLLEYQLLLQLLFNSNYLIENIARCIQVNN